MAWYFLGWFSRISDVHPQPFYPEVPPPPPGEGVKDSVTKEDPELNTSTLGQAGD